MRALILVDVQNDFLPGGALGIAHADEILPILNALEKKFSCIVATKDWHPENHISFALHHGKEPGEVLHIGTKQQELWPVHCVQDTFGSELSSDLDTKRVEKVFLKGVDSQIDSYSTFFDNAHERSTGLFEYLKQRGVTEVYIAGLATEYCVKYSALDAVELGFKVYVVTDGCRGINLAPEDVRGALLEMQSKGVELITSQEVL